MLHGAPAASTLVCCHGFVLFVWRSDTHTRWCSSSSAFNLHLPSASVLVVSKAVKNILLVVCYLVLEDILLHILGSSHVMVIEALIFSSIALHSSRSRCALRVTSSGRVDVHRSSERRHGTLKKPRNLEMFSLDIGMARLPCWLGKGGDSQGLKAMRTKVLVTTLFCFERLGRGP